MTSGTLTDAEIDLAGELLAISGVLRGKELELLIRVIGQAREANNLRALVAEAEKRGYDQGVKAGHEQAVALRRLRLP